MKTQIALITQQQLKKQTRDLWLVYLLTVCYSLSTLVFPQILSKLIAQATGGNARWSTCRSLMASAPFSQQILFYFYPK